MRRREFITVVGGAAVAWPLAAQGRQSNRVPLVGVLSNLDEADTEAQAEFRAFREELQKLSWVDGKNINIEFHGIAGDLERAKTAAARLVDKEPDVIVSVSGPLLQALQTRTQSIPIVFLGVSDVIRGGFVNSLARPGGNTTGFTNFEAEFGGKWLEMLKVIAPAVDRVAVIHNPEISPQLMFLRAIKTLAVSMGVDVLAAGIHNAKEITDSIALLTHEKHGGLIVVPNPITLANCDLIVDLAGQHSLPAVYAFGFFVRRGGLASYGLDQSNEYRKAASYVARILRGEKPADLPVQAPTKFELVINLKTAKALGLNLPQTLLATADEVIE